MFKLVLDKAEEPETKLPTSTGSSKKQDSFRKTSISALLTIPKPLTVDHNKLENSERDGNTRPPDLPLEKSVCRSGSNITNKASRGDGIPVELFQILKDDAMKVLHSICQQIWKTPQWPQDWKRSVFIPIQKKGNAKECSNYHTMARISQASKVMLKILQARLQQYMNFQMFKLDL